MESRTLLGKWVVVGLLGSFLVPRTVSAVVIKGSVQYSSARPVERTIGFTKTRVASPSTVVARRGDLSIFLEATNTLPIPAPTDPWPVKLHGIRFVPTVLSCVIDEELEFINDDTSPISVSVDDESVGQLKPTDKAKFKCKRSGTFNVRAKEWPHMRAVLYVGEVGVTARPDGEGKFQMNAPDGTYQLKVIGAEGVLASKPITVSKTDMDLGVVLAAEAGRGDPPAKPEKTEKEATPPPAPKPAAPKLPLPAKAKAKADGDEIQLEP